MKYLTLVFALILAPLVRAVPIIGEIHVNGFGSTAAIDFTANTVTFTPGAPGTNAIVAFTTGDYNSVPIGTTAVYQNFQYSPLVVAGPIWRIDADTYFTLTAVTSFAEAGGLTLQGTGVAFHDGFTPTQGVWSFSADSSGHAFAFSSTSMAFGVPGNIPGVPDSGTTAVLTVIAVAGLAAFHLKMRIPG